VNNDGTFFILGNSVQTSSSLTKVYLAKIDASGDVKKQIFFGGYSMDARDMELTSDGKLVVVSNRQSPTRDVLLSRYSLDLNPIDSVVLSAGGKANSFANSVTQLSDGGFIIEGYQGDNATQSAEMHIRVDAALNKYAPTGGWTETSTVTSSTVYNGIKTIQHNAVTFYMFGYNNSTYFNNLKNFWAYPIPYNGSENNNADLPIFGASTVDVILTNALQAKVGGFLLVGIANPAGNYSLKAAITNSYDTAFTFSSSAGIFQDKIVLDNLGSGPSPYATACSASTHNFILVNTYSTPSSNSDMLLLKVDNALSPLWTSPVQYGGNGEDTAAAVAELTDGHILVLGTMQLGNPASQYKIVLMKLNANGILSE